MQYSYNTNYHGYSAIWLVIIYFVLADMSKSLHADITPVHTSVFITFHPWARSHRRLASPSPTDRWLDRHTAPPQPWQTRRCATIRRRLLSCTSPRVCSWSRWPRLTSAPSFRSWRLRARPSPTGRWWRRSRTWSARRTSSPSRCVAVVFVLYYLKYWWQVFILMTSGSHLHRNTAYWTQNKTVRIFSRSV